MRSQRDFGNENNQVEVFDGQFTQIAISMTEIVDVEENKIIPLANNFNLNNYPNPFNPSTTISFNVTQNAVSGSDGSSFVTLEIYNLKGQKIKTFDVFPNQSSHKATTWQAGLGTREMIWNGKDGNNKPVSSGIYFYQLKVNAKTEAVKKCLLSK